MVRVFDGGVDRLRRELTTKFAKMLDFVKSHMTCVPFFTHTALPESTRG